MQIKNIYLEQKSRLLFLFTIRCNAFNCYRSLLGSRYVINRNELHEVFTLAATTKKAITILKHIISRTILAGIVGIRVKVNYSDVNSIA